MVEESPIIKLEGDLKLIHKITPEGSEWDRKPETFIGAHVNRVIKQYAKVFLTWCSLGPIADALPFFSIIP